MISYINSNIGKYFNKIILFIFLVFFFIIIIIIIIKHRLTNIFMN